MKFCIEKRVGVSFLGEFLQPLEKIPFYGKVNEVDLDDSRLKKKQKRNTMNLSLATKIKNRIQMKLTI